MSVQSAGKPPSFRHGSGADRYRTRVGVATALEAATFAAAAVLHSRPRIPLPVTTLRGDWFPHAAIPEAIIAVVLAAGATAVLARSSRAWGIAVAAHVFAIVGVLVGLAAITGGIGHRRPADIVYHATILVVLLGVLTVLLRRRSAPFR